MAWRISAAHGTVALDSTGAYTYMPDGDYNGTDSFTFQANDGALRSNTATFNVDVNATAVIVTMT